MDATEYPELVRCVRRCGHCNEHLNTSSREEGSCPRCGYSFYEKQREFALKHPNIYSQTVKMRTGGTKVVLSCAETRFSDRILAVFGELAVTTRSIECLSHKQIKGLSYFNSKEEWMGYLTSIERINIEDVQAALSCLEQYEAA
ncbi:hypothetical protein [Neptuniibacter sp. QD37_11]|uniref:hypothetical protein n=1 Tax=Neptuniibacter sp. QD37_11 TaxID=3398209 RepID=UPI0039F529D5